MNRYGYGCRALALTLVVIMIFAMLPALQFESSAAITATGTVLNGSKKITMPIKIMDYETDGMLFEYLWGKGQTHASYRPETDYWTDFTGTLTSIGTSLGRGVVHGKGFSTVSLAGTNGTYDNDKNGTISSDEKWMTVTQSSLGGKQLLTIENTKTNKNIPLQWQIARFASSVTTEDVRYATIVFRAYGCEGSGDPTLGIGTKLSENLSTRYAEGTFSGHYQLNTTGRITVAGDR